MATYGKQAKNEIPRPGYANPVKSVVIDALHNSLVQIDSSSCIIPFSLSGKIILVQGRADSMVGNLILDTGAPNFVLNSTYFRSYPVTVSLVGKKAVGSRVPGIELHRQMPVKKIGRKV